MQHEILYTSFMYIKRFLEWIGLKEKLHAKHSNPPYVNEGDIWWASLGENVGSEINGKSHKFSRPVIILKKLSHTYYFVIPASTKQKSGTWYVNYEQGGIQAVACLQHARAIDFRRLYSKLGELHAADFFKIKEGFRKLYH